MALTRINNNIPSINASRNLGISSRAMQKSLERLSSGLRINRAADDAAGLTISEKMRGQINGLNQAISNSQDGVSFIQTAEGGMDEVHTILQRMRVLSVQAANDVLTTEDRGAIQDEINALQSEIDRIVDTTEFNTRKLMDGSSGVNIQILSSAVGPHNALENFTATADTMSGALTGGTVAGTHHLNSVSTSTKATVASGAFPATVAAGSSISINNVAFSFDEVTSRGAVIQAINEKTNETGVTARMDGVNMRLESVLTGSNATFTVTGKSGTFAGATGFGVANTNHAGVDANLTVNTAGNDYISAFTADDTRVTVTAGYFKGLEFDVVSDFSFAPANWTANAAVFQVGPNNALHLQVGANENQTIGVNIRSLSTTAMEINQLDLTSHSGATDAVKRLDSAISIVSKQRSELGAIQNRLEHTIANLGVSSENLTASESRIRDADIAYETMQFTRNQILVQAGTSILSQANMAPSAVLSLLG